MNERGRMTGLDLFPTGEHRGKPWGAAELDKIIGNFDRYSAGARPVHTVVDRMGHEESTAAPANGRYVRVYKELQPCGLCRGQPGGCRRCFGTGKEWMLKGDLEDITPRAQREFADGGYPHTSVELYDSPARLNLDGDGPMIRRVSALGGEPPEVKGMRPRPREVEKYAERRNWPTTRVTETRRSAEGWVCFSEVIPMDHEAMVAKLAAMPDETLAALVASADGAAGPMDADLDRGDPAAMPPEQRAKFAEHCKARMGKFAEWSKKYGEDLAPILRSVDKPVPEKKEADLVGKYSEAEKRINAKLAQAEKFAEARLGAEKKARDEAELGLLVEQGRMFPAVKQAHLETLMLLSTDGVQKFSEGGKVVECSPHDHLLNTFKTSPVVQRFGPQVKGGMASGHADDEKAKVEAHATRQDIAAALKANGQTPDQYVSKFSEILKKDPTMTAARYGVPTGA